MSPAEDCTIWAISNAKSKANHQYSSCCDQEYVNNGPATSRGSYSRVKPEVGWQLPDKLIYLFIFPRDVKKYKIIWTLNILTWTLLCSYFIKWSQYDADYLSRYKACQWEPFYWIYWCLNQVCSQYVVTQISEWWELTYRCVLIHYIHS